MDNVRPIRPRPAKRPSTPHVRRRRIVIGVIVAAIVVLLALSSRLLGLYVDWLWFGEVGFRGVFWTRIWWHVLVGLVAAAVFFVIVAFNVELGRRLGPSFRVSETGDLLEPRSARVRRLVAYGGLAVSLLAAVLAGLSASSQWQTFLLFFKQVPFGQKDAIFGHDISFYVFSVPMWQTVQTFVFGALVTSLVFAAVVHFIMGGIEYSATMPAGPGAGGEPGGGRDPAPRRFRASISSSAAAPWPISRAFSPSSLWLPPPASCSAAGTCSTPRPERSSERATPMCTSACRLPT